MLFAIFKEKADEFVSGFNSFSKEEQAMYDKAQIFHDIRNQCFTWTVIMLAGAILSCFLTPYMAITTSRYDMGRLLLTTANKIRKGKAIFFLIMWKNVLCFYIILYFYSRYL